MDKKKLTKKELDFCRWYVALRNTREASLRAGYTILPEHQGVKLLAKKGIREKIEAFESEIKATDRTVSAGFERLAFGSTADAVKLILSADKLSSPDIEGLDLFNVAEIKYTCGKGMEIKFFDRIKALERLSELTADSDADSPLGFFEAIRKSAKMNSDGDSLG